MGFLLSSNDIYCQSVHGVVCASVGYFDMDYDNSSSVCVCVQVSESCGFVYLDGTETSGSAAATIIVKYGRHTRYLHFHVWSADIPLDVELSDIRLGRIVGWAVPQVATNSTPGSRSVIELFERLLFRVRNRSERDSFLHTTF